MHHYLTNLIALYFNSLDQIGMVGVVVLIAAMVPPEILVPPLAYLEVYQQASTLPARIGLGTVLVLAGGAGFSLGCGLLYWISRGIGRPLILRFGKYILMPEKKLRHAEEWVKHYGAAGIFFGSLVPGVRHLMCIPAGIVGMRFRTYTLMTFLGGAVWCAILTIFGLVMSKEMQILITQQGEMTPATQAAFQKLTLAVLGLLAVILVVYVLGHRQHRPAPAEETVPVSETDA
jgi:membrane protein DedA with SNARE-associated domain